MTNKMAERLHSSEFAREVKDTARALDYYITNRSRDEDLHELWVKIHMAEKALEVITGESWRWQRDGEGHSCFKNESNGILFEVKSV